MSWKKTIVISTIILSVILAIISLTSKIEMNSSLGMALCPDCKLVQQNQDPDHSLLVIAVLLAAAVIGSHTVRHFCQHKKAKFALLAIFTLSFAILIGMFGVTVTAPTSAFAVVAKRTASVMAALGVLAVFFIIAVEFGLKQQVIRPYEDDEWEKR